nr:multidrug and toxin extrusion protein 2 [Hymenolepis microstoma]
MSIACVVFVGRLGESELAAVGLALSIFNVAGFSVMHGLLSTCITVFSQTFGSGNKYRMGIELQKAIYITSICSICCWGVFLSIEPLLLAIKINPRIAKMSAEYLVYMIPAIFFASGVSVLEKYIQSQNKMIPPLVIWASVNILNALIHYILLFLLEIGIKGSAIAQSVSYLCATVLMISYLYFSKLYKNTWNGYSHAMWYDWGSWLKLGIPGLAMIALKWWYFEIGLILVGTVGVSELAAQTLLINLNQTFYNLFSVGLSIACSIIVGQSLGAGEADVPIVTTLAGLFLTCVGMLLAAILLLALRWQVPKIFTSDPNVIAIAAQCMPLFGIFLIFEGAVGVMGGAIRGSGLQPLGALTIFICLYILSAPLGFTLLLKSNLKLTGLWIGFATGLFLISIVYLILLLRTNWQKQIRLAAKRTKKQIEQTDSYDSIEISGISSEEESAVKKTSLDSNQMEQTGVVGSTSEKEQSVWCVIVSRSLFTAGMLLIFVAGLVLKLSLPLSDMFGIACLRKNGTFLWVPTANASDPIYLNLFAASENCTIFIP